MGGAGKYSQAEAERVKVMAEQFLDSLGSGGCVLCTIKWCKQGDLCMLPENHHYQLKANNSQTT